MIVEALMEMGLVKHWEDLFLFAFGPNAQDAQLKLSTRKGWGAKKVSNFVVSINNAVTLADGSRGISFQKLLLACAIPGVGEHASEALASKFTNFTELLQAPIESLAIPGAIGTKKCVELANALQADSTRYQALEMTLHELDIPIIKKEQTVEVSFFVGKTFYFTGSLKSSTRDEMGKRIKMAGGVVKNSLVKNLNYLVVGDNAVQNKIATAKGQGTAVLSETDLLVQFK